MSAFHPIRDIAHGSASTYHFRVTATDPPPHPFDEESEAERVSVTLAALRWLGTAMLPFMLVPLASAALSPSSFVWASISGLTMGIVTGLIVWKRAVSSPVLSAVGAQLALALGLLLVVGTLFWVDT